MHDTQRRSPTVRSWKLSVFRLSRRTGIVRPHATACLLEIWIGEPGSREGWRGATFVRFAKVLLGQRIPLGYRQEPEMETHSKPAPPIL